MDAALYQLLTNGTTVLTASRYLAHSLRADYARMAQAQGLIVWPTPRILPWATYLRSAAQQQRNLHAQLQQPAPRLLSELQALALWEQIIAESDVGQSLLNPAAAARNAQRSWQRLYQQRIPLHRIAAYASEEAQTWLAWAQQFSVTTEQRHWLDSARFAEYLIAQRFNPDTALAVYGFDDETPDMHALLNACAALGTRIHRLSGSTIAAAQISVVAANDSATELHLAAQWARAQVTSGRRVAIVAPHLTTQLAQVTRGFAAVFAPGQTNLQPAFRVVATPLLNGYPLVHQALLLLRLLQGRADVLLVGQLLRGPFLAGYDAEAAARALADNKARDERREYWDCNELERLAATAHCPQLAACMQATAVYLRDHRNAALPSQWAERFAQLLKLAGWGQGRSLDSAEQQTLNKFQRVLAELSALDELLGTLSLSRAIAAVRDACHAEHFAPESSDQAVTLIDVDSAAGMQVDALWVMGLHAGEWPPAPEPDVFLPIELQRECAMPEASAAGCLRLANHKLQRLVCAAPNVIFSWPQHEEDAELRPSPLLSAWAELRVEAVPLANVTVRAAQLFAQRPSLEIFQDDHAPPLMAGKVRGGSSILELQSRCPFRAQAQLRLHAAPMPTVSPAVEATERGQLVHRVLTELWQQLQDSFTLQAMHRETLAQQVRDIAQRIAQQVIPARSIHRQRLVALEMELCVQWIMALLEVEAARPAFRVRRVEQREAFEFSGLAMNIQLDRIDELSDGGALLIDYKTGVGNNASDWLDHTPGRPRSPQLPLYALAHRQQLAGIAFAVLAPGKAEFRGIADTDTIAPGIVDYAQQKPYRKLPGVETWDELLQHWQKILSVLAHQYLSGAAYVEPLKNECTYCHLRGLCRINELLAAVDDADEQEDSDD